MTKIYTSVDNATVEVQKLYGSKDGRSVLLYDRNSGGAEDYGTLYYYESQEDMEAQNRKSIKFVSAKDYFAICNINDGGMMEGWSATVGEEKLTVYSGAEWGAEDFPVICGFKFGTVDYIPGGFLAGCFCLDMELVIPDTIKTIGHSFLARSGYNLPLHIPDSVEEIETYARDRWSAPSAQFLVENRKFNSELTMPERFWKQLMEGPRFLNGCSAFNQPITIPNSVTTLGEDFMSWCGAFTQPIDLNNVTTLKTSAMAGWGEYNSPVDFSKVTSFGDNAPSSWTSYNHPITLAEGVRTAYGVFLGFSAFNQPLTIPNGAVIGPSFLGGAESFNSPITVSEGVVSVDTQFMSWTQKMTNIITVNCPASVFASSPQTLATISDSVDSFIEGTQIGGTYADDFLARFPNNDNYPFRALRKEGEPLPDYGTLYYVESEGGEEKSIQIKTKTQYEILCTIGTSSLEIAPGLMISGDRNVYPSIRAFDFGKKIGTYDVAGPNGGVILPATPRNFMSGCTGLERVSAIPEGVQGIGDNFLSQCPNLNCPIILPQSCWLIGIGFMSNPNNSKQSIQAFNSPIELGGVREIGDNFLQGQFVFNQPLTIPSSVAKIGYFFMGDTQSMTSPLTVEAPVSALVKNGDTYDGTLSLSPYTQGAFTPVSESPAYTQGVSLTGTYAEEWLAAIPNQDGSPGYRKLYLA